MATLDIGSIVRGVYDAFNQRDFDRALTVIHPDMKETIVPFGLKLSAREHMELWDRAFPDAQVEVLNLVAQGDLCVAEFCARGTHTGPLNAPGGTIAPSNRRFEMRFIEVFEFRNGRISAGRTYFDAASMMQQLGVGTTSQAPGAEAKPQPQPATARH